MEKMKALVCCRQLLQQSHRCSQLKPIGLISPSAIKIRSYAEEKSNSAAPSIRHRPSNLDKRFLVWAKKYKTMEEVPETVSLDSMEAAKSKARIKINLWMMAFTTAVCVVMIIWGKRDAKRGESVHKMNLDWHASQDKSTPSTN